MISILSDHLRHYRTIIVLFSLVVIEVFSQGYGVHINAYLFTVSYIIAGVAIGLWILNHKNHKPIIDKTAELSSIWSLASCALMILLFISYAKDTIVSVPINYRTADMLPIIKIMGERFLSNENTYALIPEIWDGMKPIYLPAMWMPYILSVLGGFDIRWIGISSIAIISFILWIPSFRQFSAARSLGFIPYILLIAAIVSIDSSMLTMTEEPIVLLWYILLCFALHRKSEIGIGIAIALCLLSRYALAPWVLLLGFVLLHQKEYKQLSKIVLSSLLLTLILLWWSGAIYEVPTFLSLEGNYLRDIVNQPNKYHWMIHSSLGIAKYLPYERLPILHQVMKITSFIIPIVCAIWYLSSSVKIKMSYFALGSLKLSLVFFYNLLIMPYSYLFYTSTLVSIFILIYFINDTLHKDPILTPKHS